MQFIDLKKEYSLIEKDIQTRISAVLEHGKYIMGPEIAELESLLASYVGVKHCVSCSSGTDALLMPLMASEVGQGDAVFTTPFTFIATAEVINMLGATPVFVDIDKDTYNICPNQLEKSIEKIHSEGKLNPKTIIPVDLFGLPANYDSIESIAQKYNLQVLEDAAQGFGGSIQGQKSGSFGNVASTSFFPAKPLGCYGDGGAVFTNDDELAVKLKSIRIHGMGENKYENVRVGLNGRMDTIQATILISKMSLFDDEVKMRNKVAQQYSSNLNQCVVTPNIPDGYISAWAQYSILAKDEVQRNKIQCKLKEDEIPSAIYYPIPLHLQKAFSSLGYAIGDFPISEEISNQIISLPMHPYLETQDIDKISSTIINLL